MTTVNADGQSNVAPKSWISMMAFEPPLVALGCNLAHWIAQNILQRQEFVINMPGDDLTEVVWKSHTKPHPRPVEAIGLTPVPAQLVKPPLIDECKAHIECELAQSFAFGNEVILFGRIVAGSIDRQALESRDPYEYMKLLVFLEGNTFGVIEKAQRLQDV